MPLPLPTAEVWHDHYDDPSGNLILISDDGVKFRTSARLLAKTCLYPGPLPDDHPLSTGGATPRKIRLEFPATTVVNFLDIASVSTPTLTTDYDGTVKLLELADRLRAYKLISHLKALLYVHVESRPLDMLVLASDRNDLEMGQKAIAKLDSNHVKSLRSRPGGFGPFTGNFDRNGDII